MDRSTLGDARIGARRTCLISLVLWLTLPAAAVGKSPAPPLAEIDASYRQAMDSELYSEAVDAQKRYIGILLSQPDHDRAEWGRALDRLATAQLFANDVDSAIENFTLSVEVLEEETNRLDAAMFQPLVGLGRAQAAAGLHADAIDTYRRAIHVQQVNFGPHAFEQAEILDAMSRAAFQLGDYDAANQYKQAFTSVYRQNFEDDYLQQVDALLSQAKLLKDTGRLLDAQYSYRRVIADIEGAAGGRSLALLPAIYEFADLLMNHSIADGIHGTYKAGRFLRRAVFIAERNKQATPLDRADAYIAYADFLNVHSDDEVSARRYYRRAWDELSGDPGYEQARKQRFGRPVLLNPVPHDSSPVMRKVLGLAAASRNVPDLARLAASFDIDDSGDVRNVEIVEGDPTGYMDPIFIRHVDMFVFRPGFVEAKPTTFKDQVYVVEYPATAMGGDLGQNSLGLQAN